MRLAGGPRRAAPRPRRGRSDPGRAPADCGPVRRSCRPASTTTAPTGTSPAAAAAAASSSAARMNASSRASASSAFCARRSSSASSRLVILRARWGCRDEGFGAPRKIRTSDPRLRRPMLYPAELWAQGLSGSIRTQVHGGPGVRVAHPCNARGAFIRTTPNCQGKSFVPPNIGRFGRVFRKSFRHDVGRSRHKKQRAAVRGGRRALFTLVQAMSREAKQRNDPREGRRDKPSVGKPRRIRRRIPAIRRTRQAREKSKALAAEAGVKRRTSLEQQPCHRSSFPSRPARLGRNVRDFPCVRCWLEQPRANGSGHPCRDPPAGPQHLQTPRGVSARGRRGGRVGLRRGNAHTRAARPVARSRPRARRRGTPKHHRRRRLGI